MIKRREGFFDNSLINIFFMLNLMRNRKYNFKKLNGRNLYCFKLLLIFLIFIIYNFLNILKNIRYKTCNKM
jgi:hypothetical protein